jgi:hypothetical protein
LDKRIWLIKVKKEYVIKTLHLEITVAKTAVKTEWT